MALDLDGDKVVREARIALGGVATVPWRAQRRGRGLAPARRWTTRPSAPRRRPPSPARAAAEHNAFKIDSASARLRARCGRRPLADLGRRAGDANSERIEMAAAHRSEGEYGRAGAAPRRALKVTGEARYASDFRRQQPRLRLSGDQHDRQGPHRPRSISPKRGRCPACSTSSPTRTRRATSRPSPRQRFDLGRSDFGPEIDHDGQIVAVVLADTLKPRGTPAAR